jgi:hypothetical protein
MSYDDDITAPNGVDDNDEFGSDEFDLDDDLDPEDDDMDWDETEEEYQGSDDRSPGHL